MNYYLKNAKIVNEGKVFEGSVLITNGKIERIFRLPLSPSPPASYTIIDLNGKYLLPGVIDDQVHFRDPGLTHKGDLFTESRAAVAGGVTSFMDMPNTIPNAVTLGILEDKFSLASEKSFANFSFFMGGSNLHVKELLKVDPKNVCGIKLFLGSSTGNMLVDDPEVLKTIFAEAPGLIAAHCEDESTVKQNLALMYQKYGDDIPVQMHPEIRSEEACFTCSEKYVEMAEKYGSRFHVIHISTAKELSLFRNDIPLAKKKITNEVCVHHLWFNDSDYEKKGNQIKWNPAIKKESDREALFNAVLNDTIDVIATDHAPHTWEEKSQSYIKAPSGAPLVQHSLVAMLEFVSMGKITLEKLVQKMSHDPAILFRIEKRGHIREGYWADLVVVDPETSWTVSKENILYKCKWSPLEGEIFHHKVLQTFVNGDLVFDNGIFDEDFRGSRLKFKS
ncbi:MAG: dihydroorotase [Bacteroidota bacterium]